MTGKPECDLDDDLPRCTECGGPILQLNAVHSMHVCSRPINAPPFAHLAPRAAALGVLDPLELETPEDGMVVRFQRPGPGELETRRG